MQQKYHRSVSLLLFWKCLVNLLAALNFANVFKNKKKRLENKKTLIKNVKKRDQNKKRKKSFYIYARIIAPG